MKTFRFFITIPLAVALLSACATPVMAQEATTGPSSDADVPALVLSWEPPTTREDGSALAASDISHYYLACEHQVSSETVHHKIAAVADRPYVVKKSSFLPDPGAYQCHMTVWDTDGNTSKPSNDVAMAWNRSAPSSFIIIVN